MIKNENKCVQLLKSVVLLLLTLLMLLCFNSCKKNETADGDEQVENNEIASLLKGNFNAYQVVRSDTMNGDELRSVLSFIDVIQQNGYSELKMVSDYAMLNPIIDTEIIIGETTRKGSVYNENEGAVIETDAYSIYIVEKRLIFTYTDSKGLIDGLEYILFCTLDAEEAALRETYNMELFERDVKRYAHDDFTIKNHVGDGSVFSADEDILFLGTSASNSTVTVQLAKGFDVLSSFDAVTDADGVWKTNVKPNTEADSIMIRIDGNIAERYSDISFKKNEINTCSDGTKVYINGKQVDVHVNEGGNYVVSSLAKAESKMEIKLVRPSKVNDCVVRPLSEGVEPDMSGKEITFTVTEFPCKLSVEFDGFHFVNEPQKSVQLFLYPYEEFTPDLDGRGLMYFAPGEYWVDQTISVPSNTTVYIDEGAVLHGKFEVKHAKNVTIMGRGIIDTYYFKVETHMAVFEKCTNLTLKDYTITGPRKWMTVLKESNTCLVDSLNILGTEVNSDGVDIVGSQNVTVTNCFLRTNDDCIAIKSRGSNVTNVTIKGCILWNRNYGNGLEIGLETSCDEINNITFEDNDILYVDGSCMSIHLGDRANVSDITYKNIRIENLNQKLIEYYIKETRYTEDAQRGTISNISIEKIIIVGDSIGQIIFEGYDANHTISNVSIGKIRYGSRYLSASQLNINLKNSYINNIKYDGQSVS